MYDIVSFICDFYLVGFRLGASVARRCRCTFWVGWLVESERSNISIPPVSLTPTSLIISLSPDNSKCNHVIAFDMYGKGNKQCAKKKEGTYIMDVGKFARAYVGQKQIDYQLQGNDYGGADALDYTDCTAVEYNDAYVS